MRTMIETATLVRRGELSALESVREAYAQIERKNPALVAFVQMDRAAAERDAVALDARIARGADPGPLAGVPIGVKDIEPCAGYRVTQGSWFLRDTPISTDDSRHVARLRAAGAIVVGITAMSEFGMDSATQSELYGVTRNPWNLATTPGGSSGGSAAAVAAGMVPLATGSDAGGSIREPAAFCGLVGLKPSHGRIPKQNGFANWSVFGALTRTVADAARHLDVACGPHDGDRQSLPAPGLRYEHAIESLETHGLRAAWSTDYGFAPVESEVAAIAHRAAMRLVEIGGLELRDTRVELMNVIRDWGVLQLVTLEDDFHRQGILPDGYPKLSPPVRHLIDLMRARRAEIDVPASWKRMYAFEKQVGEFFAGHDVLLSPATACAPYPADALMPDEIEGRDASGTHAEPFGAIANVCWNPAISVPAGVTRAGLPVGLQIVVRRHRDDIALRLARLLECDAPWPFLAD